MWAIFICQKLKMARGISQTPSFQQSEESDRQLTKKALEAHSKQELMSRGTPINQQQMIQFKDGHPGVRPMAQVSEGAVMQAMRT